MAATFGARLREIREASGISRARLAARVGVTYAYIRQLEEGDRAKGRVPRADLVNALAEQLGISADDLLKDTGVPAAPTVRAAKDRRTELLEDIHAMCERLDVATLESVRQIVAGLSKAEQRASQ